MSQARANRRKQYSSVPEMIRDVSEDRTFAESVAKRIEERNIINLLMALRTSLDMSQKDIADKMGCTQSRISKLENGKDDDLRIGDFHKYAEALGLRLMILLANKKQPPIAERIKYHTSALKRLFAELSDLVGDDDAMRKGAFQVALEIVSTAATGFARLVKDIVQWLPQGRTD